MRLHYIYVCKAASLGLAYVAHVRTVEHGVWVGVTRFVLERSCTAGNAVTVRVVSEF